MESIPAKKRFVKRKNRFFVKRSFLIFTGERSTSNIVNVGFFEKIWLTFPSPVCYCMFVLEISFHEGCGSCSQVGDPARRPDQINPDTNESKEGASLVNTPQKAAKTAKPMRLHRKTLGQRILENWQLYLLLIIPVVITIIYKYIPMYGIQIAFRDYKPARGFFGSKWVGWYWFERFFTAPTFKRMIVNTVKLSLYSLLWSFPVPIILALAINQLRFKKYKRVVQTVLYAPHFISIMVVCGMIRIFLSPYGGLINLLIGKQVDFMTVPSAFRTIYISSGIWQDAGWGTIIYLATLSAVDPGLYEAAKIDGASMFQRIRIIDIPELIPMIILQLIMSVSGLMSVGFEKVFLLQTQLNKATSDVIAVYVYEQGIVDHAYSYSTAIGLFNTVINIVLLIVVNKIAKKAADVSFV